jgi:hypothetical protein
MSQTVSPKDFHTPPTATLSSTHASTGKCTFYDTEGLRYNTQLLVRSSRGKNSKGSKITGIEVMTDDDKVHEFVILPEVAHANCSGGELVDMYLNSWELKP